MFYLISYESIYAHEYSKNCTIYLALYKNFDGFLSVKFVKGQFRETHSNSPVRNSPFLKMTSASDIVVFPSIWRSGRDPPAFHLRGFA
jgi:hypothetical protein